MTGEQSDLLTFNETGAEKGAGFFSLRAMGAL